MYQKTENPYSDIGPLFSAGLNAIIAGLPGSPTTDDLITEVSDYIASIGAAWFGTVLTPQTIEIKSIARSAINSYINNKYLGTYQREQKVFINEIMVQSVIDNTTLDSLKDWIIATEDKVVKSNLSIEAQAPLLLATIIGETAVDYFITKVGTPGAWAPYFSAAQVSAMGNIPFWTSTGMEAALIGARTTPRGMLAPSTDAVSNEMMSALVAALTITTGKVVFQWVPDIIIPDREFELLENNSFWIPKGSKVEFNNANSLTITPPSGYIYIGYEVSEGAVPKVTIENVPITISCTCNDSSGSCTPWYAKLFGKEYSGCTGTCKDCSMKQSSARGTHYTNGGFINLSMGVSFADKNNLEPPFVFEAMFSVPELEVELNKFVTDLFLGSSKNTMNPILPKLIKSGNRVIAPEGYSLKTVNIFGRLALIALPIDLFPGGVDTKASCASSCTDGTCKVDSKNIWGVGTVYWCTAGCKTTCSLSMA